MKEGRREGEGKRERERERETGREIECPCVRKEEDDGGEREGDSEAAEGTKLD